VAFLSCDINNRPTFYTSNCVGGKAKIEFHFIQNVPYQAQFRAVKHLVSFLKDIKNVINKQSFSFTGVFVNFRRICWPVHVLLLVSVGCVFSK